MIRDRLFSTGCHEIKLLYLTAPKCSLDSNVPSCYDIILGYENFCNIYSMSVIFSSSNIKTASWFSSCRESNASIFTGAIISRSRIKG